MQSKKLIMFQIKDKTYPDGTKSTATVPVTVIAPNVPDVIYVPKGDKVPDPSTVVTNSNDIKDKIPDTTYTWKTTPATPNTKVVINYRLIILVLQIPQLLHQWIQAIIQQPQLPRL